MYARKLEATAVIAGERAGTKAAKAEALGIPLLGEDDLRALLRGELPGEGHG